MSDVDALIDALRTIQARHAFASRDESLTNRLEVLYSVLGNADTSDDAIIIRALFELAGLRRETLAALGHTRRRQADVLARKVRELTEAGLSASQIASKLGMAPSSVYRLRARFKPR